MSEDTVKAVRVSDEGVLSLVEEEVRPVVINHSFKPVDDTDDYIYTHEEDEEFLKRFPFDREGWTD